MIVAARPSVGKSAFALDLAETAARAGHKTLVFSLEMQNEELAERLAARRSGVPMGKLIDRTLSDDDTAQIAAACDGLSRLPLQFCDRSNTTTSQIRQAARATKGLELLVVDYAGLLRADRKSENRNFELGQISRDLKNLASELRVPVVLLCQLNRSVDEMTEPTPAALRDSGELEQNASKILFLWKVDRENGIIGVSVAKNRRGRTGSVQMVFDGSQMRFTELTQKVPAPKKREGFL